MLSGEIAPKITIIIIIYHDRFSIFFKRFCQSLQACFYFSVHLLVGLAEI